MLILTNYGLILGRPYFFTNFFQLRITYNVLFILEHPNFIFFIYFLRQNAHYTNFDNFDNKQLEPAGASWSQTPSDLAPGKNQFRIL